MHNQGWNLGKWRTKESLWRVPVVTLTLSILLKAGVNLFRIMAETTGQPAGIQGLPLVTLALYVIAGHFYFAFCKRREITWSACLAALAQGIFYAIGFLCRHMEYGLGSFLSHQILQWLFQGGEGVRLWLQNSVGVPAEIALAAGLALPFMLVPFGYIPKRVA